MIILMPRTNRLRRSRAESEGASTRSAVTGARLSDSPGRQRHRFVPFATEDDEDLSRGLRAEERQRIRVLFREDVEHRLVAPPEAVREVYRIRRALAKAPDRVCDVAAHLTTEAGLRLIAAVT